MKIFKRIKQRIVGLLILSFILSVNIAPSYAAPTVLNEKFEVSINSGSTYTTSSSIRLDLSLKAMGINQLMASKFPNNYKMMISESSKFKGAKYIPFTPSTTFSLSKGEGTKTVYVKLQMSIGKKIIESLESDTIILDTLAPTGGSVIIEDGATYTTDSTVKLTIVATGATHMMISESSLFVNAVYEPYVPSESYSFSTGDSVKKVYVKFKDEAGNESAVVSDTIILYLPAYTTTATIATNNPVVLGNKGSNNTLSLFVKDSLGDIDASFNGVKAVNISGCEASSDSTYGLFNDTTITSASITVGINFAEGVAHTNLKLNAVTPQTITFRINGVSIPFSNSLYITPKLAKKAMWVWNGNGSTIISNESETQALIDFCKSKSVDIVYIQTEYWQVSEEVPSTYKNFNKKLHDSGIWIEALGGAPEWSIEHNYALNAINNVIEYNNSCIFPSEKFDGIHHDVEFYLLPGREDNAIPFINMVSAARNLTQNNDLIYTLDLPFWSDEVIVTYNGNTQPVYKHVFDIADNITLMAYRNLAGDIIDISQNEVNYASDIGKFVFVGVETNQSSEGPYVSFFGKTENYMDTELSKVINGFDGMIGFGGVSIHSYEGYKNL